MRDLEKERCTVPNLPWLWDALVKIDYRESWEALLPTHHPLAFIRWDEWIAMAREEMKGMKFNSTEA